MSRIVAIPQPSIRTTLDAITDILQTPHIEAMDIAAAYITVSGAQDLLQRVNRALGNGGADVVKRWITSFDYCRTQPLALEALLSLPNSDVRIYDAAFCLQHGGVPRVPFHPKTLLIRGEAMDWALAGSGNISRSGLSRGVEAGLVVSVDRTRNVQKQMTAESIDELRSWFSHAWDNATPLTHELLERYRGLYSSAANLGSPVPTEDDVVTSDLGRDGLSSADLRKLRACEHFWIEAGKITKNRGRHLPGNQLMMKRLSRVYFGFPSVDVPKNSAIGEIDIRFGGLEAGPYSLTYSDNSMDKLILPLPGDYGPPSYDHQNLLFRAIGPGRFELTLGSSADKSTWLRKSKAIDAAFTFKSDRQWGVF